MIIEYVIMASKSTESKITTESPILQTVENESSQDEGDTLRGCHEYFYGIKTSDIWKTPSLDRTKSTYFILPESPGDYRLLKSYVASGTIQPTVRDFEKFWFDELSDIHKDRYLLVNYMAYCLEEIRNFNNFGVPDATVYKKLSNEKISQLLQLIRGFVMEKNTNKFRRGGALSLFTNSHSVEAQTDILLPHLGFLKYSRTERLEMMRFLRFHPRLFESLEQRLGSSVAMLAHLVFSGFVKTYFVWVSYDAQNLRRYTNAVRALRLPIADPSGGESRLTDRIEFMRKLKLAAPRWSRDDRRMILEAIETDGKSCRGTYVQILLKEVGVAKFKKLAFGKHRFCAHCHRSSYTGEDRLLACKRCDTEGVRPRAWYCDRQCQKADWRQHRASKHPPVVVEEEKAGKKKKKRKPRKK